MSIRHGRAVLAPALSVVAIGLYFAALHVLVVDGRLPSLTLAMIVAPWVAATASVLRPVIVVLVALAAAAVAWSAGPAFAGHLDLLLFVENLAFHLFLAVLFAIGLRPGHEALVTRLARIAHDGDLPAEAVPYTRAVSLAWSLFFTAVAVMSATLFFTQSREAWSLFVNLLIWPLLLAMFALEYALRLRVLPNVVHPSMLRGMTAFQKRHDR